MLCGTPLGGTASRSAISVKATKVGQEFAKRRNTAPALILTAAWIVIRAHQLEFWTSSECGSTGGRFARSVGRSWRVDEKYVKIRGEWCYLCRAGDRAGGTIDFRLSAKGAGAAATAFFRKVNKSQPRAPLMITQDGCAAPHRAVRELKADGSLPADTKVRASKYLNNLIERSHRAVRQRITAMLGLTSFGNARIAVRIGAARTFNGEPRWHSWERGAWCVKSPPKIQESVSSRRLFAPAPS
jgi:DDE domain